MIYNTSGGTSLNFKVVGGTTQPTSPKENTIWVNTSTAITGWEFSPTEPATPAEGMVWISTGTSSAVEFNALKKNGIQVCPLAAKQYVGGQWGDKEAKIYQGGQWVDWVTYLYAPGDECTDNGGHWVTAAKNLTSSGGGAANLTLTLGASGMTIAQTNAARGGICYKEDPIDLTEATTIVVKANVGSAVSQDKWKSLNVWTSIGSYIESNRAAALEFGTQSGDVALELDVSSLSGEYIVGLGLYSTASITVSEVVVR